MIYNLSERRVRFMTDNHFIASCAHVIGDVEVGDDVSIWFNAVIRADCGRIAIGDGSNIQDGCVLHCEPWNSLLIGRRVTVGHLAMVHGCTIGDSSLIGINAVVLDDVVIGRNCLIGANSLVKSRMIIPDGTVVMGSPAKIIRDITDDEIKMIQASADFYINNGKKFRQHLVDI
jgi:carbonic anhydrase/acetyltransferase-like protein (isoleucine patch superfamily)